MIASQVRVQYSILYKSLYQDKWESYSQGKGRGECSLKLSVKYSQGEDYGEYFLQLAVTYSQGKDYGEYFFKLPVIYGVRITVIILFKLPVIYGVRITMIILFKFACYSRIKDHDECPFKLLVIHAVSSRCKPISIAIYFWDHSWTLFPKFPDISNCLIKLAINSWCHEAYVTVLTI